MKSTIRAKKAETHVQASCGNVFADLGVAQPSVALAKAELAYEITQIIRARGLKQVQVAEVLGIDQGKVSSLVRGHLSGFSTERLFKFLNSLGRNVEIVIRKERQTDEPPSVTVCCR